MIQTTRRAEAIGVRIPAVRGATCFAAQLDRAPEACEAGLPETLARLRASSLQRLPQVAGPRLRPVRSSRCVDRGHAPIRVHVAVLAHAELVAHRGPADRGDRELD